MDTQTITTTLLSNKIRFLKIPIPTYAEYMIKEVRFPKNKNVTNIKKSILKICKLRTNQH